MVCAVEWRYTPETDPTDRPTSYDVWVSRALNGDLLFNTPLQPANGDTYAIASLSAASLGPNLKPVCPFKYFPAGTEQWRLLRSRCALNPHGVPAPALKFTWPMESECFHGGTAALLQAYVAG